MIKVLDHLRLDSKLGHLPLVQKFDQVPWDVDLKVKGLMKVDDQSVGSLEDGLKVGSFEGWYKSLIR